MMHAFAWDPAAIAVVHPDGTRPHRKFGRGAYACSACRALLGMTVRFGAPDMDDCPGPPPLVRYGLPGSDLDARPFYT
jgi:hypothetical protein